MVAEKLRAIAPRARPAIVEAIEAAQIHTLGASGTFGTLQQTCVDDGEHSERQPRDHRPRAGNARTHRRHPEQHGGHAGNHQPAVRQEKMGAIELGDPGAPPGETAIVLRARISQLCEDSRAFAIAT